MYPALPFDNLYKFVAIFGLVIFVWGNSQNQLIDSENLGFDHLGRTLLLNQRQQERIHKLLPSINSSEYSEQKRELLSKLLELENEEDKLQLKLLDARGIYFGWQIAPAFFIGVPMMFCGFGCWWFYVQKPQDEMLQLDLTEKRKKAV